MHFLTRRRFYLILFSFLLLAIPLTGSSLAQQDRDGDGYADTEDVCPDEGNRGFGLDGEGCPYKDTDGDGMFDRDDTCPYQGDEGGRGVDPDGCPYYDADWDGVYDRDDACPYRADEYGYGIDSTGCPLEAPEPPPSNNGGNGNPPPANNGGNNNPPPSDNSDDNDSDDPPPPASSPSDQDWDGVPDETDLCPTEGDWGLGLDVFGCPLLDTDGDGVIDRVDACPYQGNEGGLGVDDDGCPYYDTDWDGFYDRVDACPYQGNEGGLGVDEYGCPYYDTDGDRLIDREDTCPYQGDEGGLGVDPAGCPYYDSDRDGIKDRSDACRYRGDEYGYGIDDTGCPLEAPAAPDDDDSGDPGDDDDSGDPGDDDDSGDPGDDDDSGDPGDDDDSGDPGDDDDSGDALTASASILPEGWTYVQNANGVDYLLDADGNRQSGVDPPGFILDFMGIREPDFNLLEEAKAFIEENLGQLPALEFEGVSFSIPVGDILGLIEISDITLSLEPFSVDPVDLIAIALDRVLGEIDFDVDGYDLEVPEIFILKVDPISITIPSPVFFIPDVNETIDGFEVNLLDTLLDVVEFLASGDSPKVNILGVDLEVSLGAADVIPLAIDLIEVLIGDYGNRWDEYMLLTFENTAELFYNEFVPFVDHVADFASSLAGFGGQLLGQVLGSFVPGVGNLVAPPLGELAATTIADFLIDVFVDIPPAPALPPADTGVLERTGDTILQNILPGYKLDLDRMFSATTDPLAYSLKQVTETLVRFGVFVP